MIENSFVLKKVERRKCQPSLHSAAFPRSRAQELPDLRRCRCVCCQVSKAWLSTVTVLACSGCLNKYCRLGAPTKEMPFLTGQEAGWQSKVKVPAGLVPPEASLLGFQTATSSPGPHRDEHTEVSMRVYTPPSHKDTSQIGSGLALMASV